MENLEYFLEYGLNAEGIAEREYLIHDIIEMLEDISNIRKIRLIYEFVENIAR